MLVVVFFTGTFFAHATPITYTLQSPPEGITTVGGDNPFGDYLAGAIPFILRLAAVLAVVKIVIGGFEYAVSEAITSKQEAREDITQAVLGLLLALLSYLVLNTINPDLVQLKIPNLKPISQVITLPEPGGGGEPPPTITTFSTVCASDTNACVVTAGAGANGLSEDRCGSPCPSGTNAANVLMGENWCKLSGASRGAGSCTKKSYNDCTTAGGMLFKFQDQCEAAAPPGAEVTSTSMIICLLNEIAGTNSGDCKVTSLTGDVTSCIGNGGSKFDTAPTPDGACPTKFTCNSWQGSKPTGCH